MGGSPKSIRSLPSYARLKGANPTSVSSPPLMQNRYWRIKNYSQRDLLCESLCAQNADWRKEYYSQRDLLCESFVLIGHPVLLHSFCLRNHETSSPKWHKAQIVGQRSRKGFKTPETKKSAPKKPGRERERDGFHWHCVVGTQG